MEPPDSASSVMFALPSDINRGRFVQSEAEWRFILPHLSCHTVPFSRFIGNTVSVCIEDKTTNSMKRFSREELDFGIGVVWLHRACEVHQTLRGLDALDRLGLSGLNDFLSGLQL